MEQPYILIAENETKYVYLMEHALQTIKPAFNWAFFSDAGDLLKFVKKSETKPVLIITNNADSFSKDGINILKEVKKDRELNETPVVVFADSDAPIDIELASENNCDGYYIKGEDAEDFKDALNDMLLLINMNIDELSVC